LIHIIVIAEAGLDQHYSATSSRSDGVPPPLASFSDIDGISRRNVVVGLQITGRAVREVIQILNVVPSVALNEAAAHSYPARSGTTILPPTRSGHGPSPLGVSHCDRLGHIIGVVAAVLSLLESQSGAVPMRVLWPHRIGQLSERLCCAHNSILSRKSVPSRLRDPEADDLDRLAAGLH
jgi:hypothetical protein